MHTNALPAAVDCPVLTDTHCESPRRFINRLPGSSHTYTHSERKTGREKNRAFCAATEWEQKTNGGSYIREWQAERDGDRRRKRGQQERRAAKGATLCDREVGRKQAGLKV